MIAPLLAATLWTTSPAPQERWSAEQLIEEAWRYLPAYDGTHRPFLTTDALRETRVAAHLLEAAAALEPDHMRALWSLGHAQVLLAEDRRNRGLREEADRHFERADAVLSRAIERNPADPWAFYARGAARTSFGRHDAALGDLEHAVETADAILARDGERDSIPWLRYKSLEWKSEVLMRLGEYAHARSEMRGFHAEFSTNEWPLLIALGESHLRERDLAGARAIYEEARERFPNDFTAYAMLGYLAGLQGDRSSAARHLTDALAYEFQPGMYTRLWLWILAPDELEAAARADLAGFLEHPPGDVSAWDVTLGRFALGEGAVDAFLEAAGAEAERRRTTGEALDDLMCEAAFYAGLRWEATAAAAADEDTREALLQRARDAHWSALGHDPAAWKWEWAYARLHYADLATSDTAPAAFLDAEAVTVAVDGRTAAIVQATWHAPRAERATASLDRATRPGDLLLVRVRYEDGEEAVRHLVVANP